MASKKITNVYIKDNFLKSEEGTVKGALHFTNGSVNRNYIKQDNSNTRGLEFCSIANEVNVREITINAPNAADSWTHAQFRTSSFYYNSDVGIASEEWDNRQKASVQDVESLWGGVIKFIIKKVLGGLRNGK